MMSTIRENSQLSVHSPNTVSLPLGDESRSVAVKSTQHWMMWVVGRLMGVTAIFEKGLMNGGGYGCGKIGTGLFIGWVKGRVRQVWRCLVWCLGSWFKIQIWIKGLALVAVDRKSYFPTHIFFLFFEITTINLKTIIFYAYRRIWIFFSWVVIF